MTSSNQAIPDYRALLSEDSAILDEIIRQAEQRMSTQVQMALAADGRAGLIGSLQSTASIGLLIAAFSNIQGEASAAAVGAALLLAAAAGFAAWAAKPVAFGLPGTSPCDWIDSIAEKKSLLIDKAEYACHLDKYLRFNGEVMASNCNWVRASMVATALSPIAAVGSATFFG